LESTNFYGNTEWKDKTRASLERVFGSDGRKAPIATARSIASSGFLIKDADLVELWRNQARDIAAIEMELAGIYHAARRIGREYPILGVRGLSDIVGFKRDPGWTTYACNSASSFFLALLREMPQHFLI
jgi:nucleoside phosphorylase